MTFEEALKQVSKEAHQEPRLLLTLSYSVKLVLPYKEGLAIIEALRKAEIMTDSYSKPQIAPIPKDQIHVTILNHQDYGRYKIAGLLDVSYDEVCQQEKSTIAA